MINVKIYYKSQDGYRINSLQQTITHKKYLLFSKKFREGSGPSADPFAEYDQY